MRSRAGRQTAQARTTDRAGITGMAGPAVRAVRAGRTETVMARMVMTETMETVPADG